MSYNILFIWFCAGNSPIHVCLVIIQFISPMEPKAKPQQNTITKFLKRKPAANGNIAKRARVDNGAAAITEATGDVGMAYTPIVFDPPSTLLTSHPAPANVQFVSPHTVRVPSADVERIVQQHAFEDGTQLVTHLGAGLLAVPTALVSYWCPNDVHVAHDGLPLREGSFNGTLTTANPDQQSICTHVLATMRGSVRYTTLQSPTGSGKTCMMVYIALALGRRVLYVCTTKTLLNQAMVKGFGKFAPHLKTGRLAGRNYKKLWDCDVVMVTPKTLALQGHDPLFMNQFGVMLVDEAHKVGTREMLAATSNVNTRYRLGVSATLRRNDDKFAIITATLGRPCLSLKRIWEHVFYHLHIVKFSKDNPLNDGRLFVKTQRWGKFKGCTDFHDYQLKIITHPDRSKMVCVQLMEDIKVRGKIFVYSAIIEHLKYVRDMLATQYGTPSGILYAETNSTEQMAVNLSEQILFTTYGSGTEGVDDDAVDTIYYIFPYSNSANLRVEQSGGRCRPGHNKRTPLFRDFVDHSDVGWQMYRKRTPFFDELNPKRHTCTHTLGVGKEYEEIESDVEPAAQAD